MAQSAHDTGQHQRAAEPVPTVSAGGVATGEVPPSERQPEPDSWYVAIVKRNSEKVCRDELQKSGITAYVATQTMMRRYAKRSPKLVEYVRIPAKVFVHISPLKSAQERSVFFRAHPYISGFMSDRAKSGRGWAQIPENQMTRMRKILDDMENEVTIGFPDSSYEVGGRVRAIGGAIHGLEGIVASRGSKNYFCVEIEGFDWAKVSISKDHLEPIDCL